MTVTGLAAFARRAWLALSIASSLTCLVSAQDMTNATIEPNHDLPPFLAKAMMDLALSSPVNANIGQFGVAPLTPEAGLNATLAQGLSNVSGNLVLLDQSNFITVPYSGNVIYLSCDNNTDVSNITPDYILNGIMNNATQDNNPAAILLYSTTADYCYLSPNSKLTYKMIWTMTSSEEAISVKSLLVAQTSGSIKASITSETPSASDTVGNSQIAMSILYSITGLITVLFVWIIATGAVRAHRNPERYGPRAGTNGRPRRSRARGLAMAMLETLPIVKFGESDTRKPDEETGLEDISPARTQHQHAPQAETEAAPSSAAVPGASSTPADGEPSSQSQQGAASAPTGVSAEGANKKTAKEEDTLGCSICTEDFTRGEDVRVLPCNHQFHPACVDPWLVNVSGTCPLCRLDLRPPEDVEPEEGEDAETHGEQQTPAEGQSHNNHLAPPAAAEAEHGREEPTGGEASHRRRRSRLLDWNRLRHAPVDERIQALRQYRQSQQGPDAAAAHTTGDDERRHSRLTGRLRGRFHILNEPRNGPPAAAPQSEEASTS
ncbi:hypothetical protein F5Y17DRAFT_459611 [Xylariaceae sp. FL0594]|nr:hypothetical protein F5Y17DRAFT_459611 [Xylariaceae sp. FL0594]